MQNMRVVREPTPPIESCAANVKFSLKFQIFYIKFFTNTLKIKRILIFRYYNPKGDTVLEVNP